MSPHLSLEEQTAQVMAGLKAFQQATVERVDELFRRGQPRVLVADEVGLGKTMIARGVIAKTAILRLRDEGDELFKVVYVCSNQNIARQNVGKLRIYHQTGTATPAPEAVDLKVSETRLSMQHLRVREQEAECRARQIRIQLTPLTPATSFQVTHSRGCAAERALMGCILEEMDEFREVRARLSELLRNGIGPEGWAGLRQRFRERIARIRDEHYPGDLHCLIRRDYGDLLEELLRILTGVETRSPGPVLLRLRKMFAELSAGSLQPDLVIMDEFQRFHTLLHPGGDDDLGAITERFLRGDDRNGTARPRILLLSATPYKLYSTLEEIDSANCDEHFREFGEVINFLLDHDPEARRVFARTWQAYATGLRKLNVHDQSLPEIKARAESALYRSGLCRTERIAFMKTGDFLQSELRELQVQPGDILAYLELDELCRALGISEKVPFEYVKSSPYLMSFMEKYQLRNRIFHAGNREQIRIRERAKNLLWLRYDQICGFRRLEPQNSKFDLLREVTFEHHAERLLWVPPSMPNYEPQGVFKAAEGYSKLLLFSAWEMVPRMVASLLSYETECLTNGKLAQQARKLPGKEKQGNLKYFGSKERFPGNRLFRTQGGNERGLIREGEILSCSSRFLEDCFQPSGARQSLEELKTVVRSRIVAALGERRYYPSQRNPYVYAAALLDGGEESPSEEASEPMPADLIEVLVNMAIAAPGICVSRSLRKYCGERDFAVPAAAITSSFLRLFDSAEGAGAVAGKLEDLTSAHYAKNVLRYCLAGNFQAMLDEYCFVLVTDCNEADPELFRERITAALKLQTVNYEVDTLESFRRGDPGKRLRLRAHFAGALSQNTTRGRGEDSSASERQSALRNAFNSPFRPFVLATTSIGQEGLDFHYYCRRVMHWNLPRNPAELEQREGRVNRYLSLAVRRSLVQRYGPCADWSALLAEAERRELERAGEQHPQLAPYWCLSSDQPCKIERIVPLYPFSRDTAAYARLMKVLALYRLTMGQARQEELLNSILASGEVEENCWSKFFLVLCPFLRQAAEHAGKTCEDQPVGGKNEKEMAEGEGFEPSDPDGSAVFKTAALNHSTILPGGSLQ